MYFADHAPPRFHAEYAEQEARIAIGSLAVLSGNLPPRAMGLVAEWTTLHQKELQETVGTRAQVAAAHSRCAAALSATWRHNKRLHRTAA